MKYNSNIGLAGVIGVIFFGLPLIFGDDLLNDPDTYWHIAVGRWILDHWEIPTVDLFSNSIGGTRWITHEWLSEVIFAADYQWLGWRGLILLTALFGAAALAIFAYFVARWLESRHTILLTAFGFFLLAPHLLARPHMLALPVMIVFVGGLVAATERYNRPSLWLLPVICLWANLHGTFLVGLGFAVFFALEVFLQAGWRLGLQWLLFAILAFGSVLLTPNGIDGVLIAKTYIADIPFMMNVIKEWRPPDFAHIHPVEIWLLGFLCLSLYYGFRLPAARLALLIGLIHLALRHSRNGELLGFLAPLVILPALAPQLYDSPLAAWPFSIAEREGKAVPLSRAVAAIAVVLTAGSLAYFLSSTHDRKNGNVSPIAAVEAVRAAAVSGPVFNSYKFGGYLIFAGIPPFIDSRGELYGDKFFERYLKAETSSKLSDLTEIISQYKIGWTLLPPDSVGNLKLATLPDWTKLYSDDFAVVYVRTMLPDSTDRQDQSGSVRAR